MRISVIKIAKFGVWQQLSLPVPQPGLTVLFGPNEAGKTTLLRFIRSALYGFEPFAVELRDGTSRPLGWEGALRVQSQGREVEIHRVAQRGTRGLVSVIGTERQEPAESLLGEILCHANESLFENVFAVGLAELQELATLAGDEVGRQIFGMTLGPTGRRLLQSAFSLEQNRHALFDPSSRSGRLVDLLEREQALRDEVAAHQALREEHAEQSIRRERIENRIDALNRKKADREQQLVGHRILERVWPHWNQVRQFRAELDAIPEVVGFPSNALGRLQRLEAEIDSAAESRRSLRERVKSLRARLGEFSRHKELHRHAPRLGDFVEQREWYADAAEQAGAARRRSDEIQAEVDRLLAGLGTDWTSARLEGVETGLAPHRRLTSAAQRYRSAVRRRNRMVRLQKRLQRGVRKRLARVDERLKPLNGVSLDDSIAEQTKRLQCWQEVGPLRQREADLAACREALAARLRRDSQRPELPQWITVFLGTLLTVGFVATAIGVLRSAVKVDVLAGASLTFIGLTGVGVAWGFRRHRELEAETTGAEERAEIERLDEELRDARMAIARLDPGSPVAPLNPWMPAATKKVSGTFSTAEIEIRADREKVPDTFLGSVARLAELKRLAGSRKALLARRRRLSELRSRFQEVQRHLAVERQNWCALLKEIGLAETVKISEALEAWQRITEARERLRAGKAAADQHQHLERSLQSFRARMEDAGRRAGRPLPPDKSPLDVLAAWDVELQSLGRSRDEYHRLRTELRESRRQLEQVRRRGREAGSRRIALFAKGGAGHRDEFLERAGWIARRRECEELLSVAEAELESAAADEPALAIVEEDLQQFDAAENERRMESLSSELEQIDRDFQSAFEELGSVKQSLRALEANREDSRLRFAEAQTRQELRQAAEEWFGIELARQAVEQVRGNFERTCQPAALALASKYLERLTRGRYANIWTPLGERELRIDDDSGNTFTVEQLSGGTREQLFLAVRMATVRELAQKGIELPMVLDDVLVNFDQLRMEAAVDALLEFSEEGQQVLFFTCHLHLAHLFEARGVETIWLPGHNPQTEERRAG